MDISYLKSLVFDRLKYVITFQSLFSNADFENIPLTYLKRKPRFVISSLNFLFSLSHHFTYETQTNTHVQ